MIDQPINGDDDIIKDSTNVWYKGKCVTPWAAPTLLAFTDGSVLQFTDGAILTYKDY